MAALKIVDGASIAPKYAPYNMADVTYKHVNGTPIPASILIPKDVKPGKHAVAVRWHGGGLGTGHRLYADWYADWTLAMCSLQPTIQITPDYRLIPEATGIDILEDAKDFYTWLFTAGNLSSVLPSSITLDFSSLLIIGESAGGWHALQAPYLLPRSAKISCIIAHYPMIDMRSAHFTQKYPKALFGGQVPEQDPSVLSAYMSALTGSEVITSRHPPDGQNLVVAMIQQGTYGEYFGGQAELYPLERLDHAETFPPTWILHGSADSVVPVQGSEKFVAKLRAKLPHVPLHVTFQEGEEHGFDLHDANSGTPAMLETDWVKPGLEFVQKYWPASSA